MVREKQIKWSMQRGSLCSQNLQMLALRIQKVVFCFDRSRLAGKIVPSSKFSKKALFLRNFLGCGR